MKRLAMMLVASLGCASAPRPAPPREQPIVLVPSEQLTPPFVVQQKLHGRHGDTDIALDVVVQLSRGKLTLVGLTPFGSRAFVLEQQGTQTKLEKFVARELPVRPEYVLADVHRVFFRGLTAPQADGEHSANEGGEHITERWQGGHVVERRFAPEGEREAQVIVRFEGEPAPRIAPRVLLENRAFGYTLTIDNVTQQLLTE